MPRILIVEDDHQDFRFAERCARWAGMTEIDASPSAEASIALLEKAEAEKRSLPDLVLLDLDLGHESGFDFLRFRYKHPQISAIPVVVWTQLGDENRHLCDMFKVQGFVTKSKGEFELVEALKKARPEPPAAG